MGTDPVSERAQAGRPFQVHCQGAVIHLGHRLLRNPPHRQLSPALARFVEMQQGGRRIFVVRNNKHALAEPQARRGIAKAAMRHQADWALSRLCNHAGGPKTQQRQHRDHGRPAGLAEPAAGLGSLGGLRGRRSGKASRHGGGRGSGQKVALGGLQHLANWL